MQNPVAPSVVKTPDNPHEDSVATHPAFGMCEVGRFTSSHPVRFFGSDLGHRGGICLTFSGAKEYRNLHTDWRHATKTLFEVWMSEAQWASLIAAHGRGQGVPVTIRRKTNGKYEDVPEIAHPMETKKELFGRELAESLKKSIAITQDATDELGDLLDGAGTVSKTALRAVLRKLRGGAENLPSNTRFLMDQFTEHVEDLTETAKIEVEAFTQNVVTRLGQDAVKAEMGKGLLPNETLVFLGGPEKVPEKI